jgi:hypothetical protein
MRKLKEVLRLRFELHLDQRQIARSCSISVSTVHEYLKRAETAGVNWPVPADWNDARLQAALFPPAAAPTRPCKDTLDCEEIYRQLRANRHVTLQLLWEEYWAANPNGYRYSRYCEIYQRWRKKQSVVMRQQHTPGEKAFIDDPYIRPAVGGRPPGVVVRRRTRRQFLHLRRSYTRPANGIVDPCPRTCLSILGRRTFINCAGQHADWCHKGLPL